MAAEAPMGIITGGPGVGKTFVTRAIVKMWLKRGKRVKLCAPTGSYSFNIAIISFLLDNYVGDKE